MTSDLDLTSYLPSNPKSITIGEKVYELSMDIPSVVYDRVLRWFDDVIGADDAKIDEYEQRGIELTARVLHIDQAEAVTFGPMVRRGVLGFLKNGGWLGRTRTPLPSGPPSVSPDSSTEASPPESS